MTTTMIDCEPGVDGCASSVSSRWTTLLNGRPWRSANEGAGSRPISGSPLSPLSTRGRRAQAELADDVCSTLLTASLAMMAAEPAICSLSHVNMDESRYRSAFRSISTQSTHVKVGQAIAVLVEGVVVEL